MLRVGLVSSWGSKCGIAEYSKALVEAMPASRFEFIVLADSRNDAPVVPGVAVERCWERGSNDISGILSAIERRGLALVVIQFNWGYLNPEPLGRLVRAVAQRAIPVVVEMHSVDERAVDGRPQSLADIADALGAASVLVVHRPDDAEYLSRLAPHVQISHSSLGQREVADESIANARDALGLRQGGLTFATFGFLFPHKGVLEAIRAADLLRNPHPDIRLLAACAVIPTMVESRTHWQRCRAEIERRGLGENVVLIRDYLDERAAMVLLHAADVAVLPYLPTTESASAAVRFVLSSKRPVITTTQPIFDGVGDAVLRIAEASPEAIARGVLDIHGNPGLAGRLVQSAAELNRRTSWAVVAENYAALLDSAVTLTHGGV